MRRGAGSWRRLRRRARNAILAGLIGVGDIAVALTPTRWLVACRLRRDRATLQRLGFEPDFYLLQLSVRRRALAARDPELHYLLTGWRESRSPARRCDQVFVASRHPGVGNPYLRIEPSHEPRNDLEALGRGATPAAEGYALVFHHARGGGSTKCLGLYEQRLEREGLVPLRLRLVPRSDRLVVIQSPDGLRVHDVVGGLPAFLEALAALSIRRIVVSHVVDFDPTRIFDVLTRIAEHLACPLELMLHDYLAVCPRINLVDAAERTCFVPPPAERCRTCVAAGGSDSGGLDPVRWRESFAGFAARAESVIVLSEDMRARLTPFLPGPLTIWQPEAATRVETTLPVLSEDDILRIAVVGALNVAKGSKVIAALGAAVQARGAPLVIEVFGASPERKLLVEAGVVVRGSYREADLGEHLASWGPHAIFIPAIWPETWSFVLTQALALGLPVFAFSHGAQAERLRAAGCAKNLIPSERVGDADAVLDYFLQFRRDCLSKNSRRASYALLD